MAQKSTHIFTKDEVRRTKLMLELPGVSIKSIRVQLNAIYGRSYTDTDVIYMLMSEGLNPPTEHRTDVLEIPKDIYNHRKHTMELHQATKSPDSAYSKKGLQAAE